MDGDENNAISLGEFLTWDYGILPIAEEAGRAEAYETALRVVFAFWDQNGDGKISRSEHRRSLSLDYRRADNDNDGVLTQDEFLGGFTVMIALRSAINPIPIE